MFRTCHKFDYSCHISRPLLTSAVRPRNDIFTQSFGSAPSGKVDESCFRIALRFWLVGYMRGRNFQVLGKILSICKQPGFDGAYTNAKAHSFRRYRQNVLYVVGSTVCILIKINDHEPVCELRRLVKLREIPKKLVLSATPPNQAWGQTYKIKKLKNNYLIYKSFNSDVYRV